MKKISEEVLRKRLTALQFSVTQESHTEPPYKNEYYKEFGKGTYTCIVCSLPLFTSDMKFDKSCGWPAFFAELEGAKIRKIVDKTHGMIRTEVRCGTCDSHLGHIFQDGPKDKGGIRYCINSASMDFTRE